jgi:hypothetical protein
MARGSAKNIQVEELQFMIDLRSDGYTYQQIANETGRAWITVAKRLGALGKGSYENCGMRENVGKRDAILKLRSEGKGIYVIGKEVDMTPAGVARCLKRHVPDYPNDIGDPRSRAGRRWK